MKVILLVLVAYASGQGQTFGVATDDAQACEKKLVEVEQLIVRWNKEKEDKVVYYAMSCGEVKVVMGGDKT